MSFLDEPDPFVNPIGVKGIGEIGITGVTAAIADAVYHATGERIRDLPITLDKAAVICAPAGDRAVASSPLLVRSDR